MLRTYNLRYNYNENQQFDFPDFECKSSEVVLITGNSGVGKTTLMHLLGGILSPKEGNLIINEINVNLLSSSELDQFRGQNIGIVLQQNHFIQALTVLENVTMASWLATKKVAKHEAIEILTHLGLKDHLHKHTSQLSVGQQQRVSIARALINKPKVLLADEPTSSLDDHNTVVVGELLQSVAKQFKTALVIVTHDSRLKQLFSNQINLS
jgi:ABC-type lipoprotein export system ATPase subunit